MSLQVKVAELVKQVPARRWLEYSRQFGRDTQDCMTDAVIAMVVVLNEQHRKDYGSPSLEKFLDMGLGELESEIRRVLDAGDEPTEGATFRADGGAGGGVEGGADADGRRGGVRADEGSAVPGDGDSAV